MDLPDDLLTRSAKEAARLLAMSFLDDATAAQERLANSEDPEALHDFRVAVRRLRSCLRAYREQLRESISGKMRRQLRALGAATRESRDLEVHLAWLQEQRASLRRRERPGVSWLITRLAQQKQQADAELHRELAGDFARVRDRLAARLQTYTTMVHLGRSQQEETYAAVTSDLVYEHVAELERCLAAVRSIADQQTAHQARIAGKRLRYLLEPVAKQIEGAADVVQRLKNIQDVLGDLHDAHVFAEQIGAALEDASVEHARRLSAAVREGTGDPEGVRREERRDPRPGLLAIATRLRERSEAAYGRVEAEWLHGRSDEFCRQVRETARALGALDGRDAEIERKYLLKGLPEVPSDAEALEIDQGWLPGTRLAERLRRVQSGDGKRWYRTVKVGSGVSRMEIEEETTGAVFEVMWPLTEGRRVRKRRYSVPNGEQTWEIDEFTDRPLVLAEIELPSEHTPVEPPDWLGPYIVREVTGEAEYVNINLAR